MNNQYHNPFNIDFSKTINDNNKSIFKVSCVCISRYLHIMYIDIGKKIKTGSIINTYKLLISISIFYNTTGSLFKKLKISFLV